MQFEDGTPLDEYTIGEIIGANHGVSTQCTPPHSSTSPYSPTSHSSTRFRDNATSSNHPAGYSPSCCGYSARFASVEVAPHDQRPLFYLGMQELVFARSNVQLKVTWRISLSDQGEVESHSSACPRFPAAWHQEATSELAKIGDAFMMLVEDRGISEAIGKTRSVDSLAKWNETLSNSFPVGSEWQNRTNTVL